MIQSRSLTFLNPDLGREFAKLPTHDGPEGCFLQAHDLHRRACGAAQRGHGDHQPPPHLLLLSRCCCCCNNNNNYALPTHNPPVVLYISPPTLITLCQFRLLLEGLMRSNLPWNRLASLDLSRFRKNLPTRSSY